jgi:hypothetical protein
LVQCRIHSFCTFLAVVCAKSGLRIGPTADTVIASSAANPAVHRTIARRTGPPDPCNTDRPCVTRIFLFRSYLRNRFAVSSSSFPERQ